MQHALQKVKTYNTKILLKSYFKYDILRQNMNDKQSPPNDPSIFSLSRASFLKQTIKHGHMNGIRPQSIGSTF